MLKRLEEIALDVKDDLEFARRVEAAWKEHDAGKFRSQSKEDFLAELKAR